MTDKEIRAYLARLGSKGGQATGKAKVRGDAAYYQRISKLAQKAKRKKAENKA